MGVEYSVWLDELQGSVERLRPSSRLVNDPAIIWGSNTISWLSHWLLHWPKPTQLASALCEFLTDLLPLLLSTFSRFRFRYWLLADGTVQAPNPHEYRADYIRRCPRPGYKVNVLTCPHKFRLIVSWLLRWCLFMVCWLVATSNVTLRNTGVDAGIIAGNRPSELGIPSHQLWETQVCKSHSYPLHEVLISHNPFQAHRSRCNSVMVIVTCNLNASIGC